MTTIVASQRRLRAIVNQAPKFKPAWGRLLIADATADDVAGYSGGHDEARRLLEADIKKAKAIFPDLPELAAATMKLDDSRNYGRNIDLIEAAVARTPDNPQLLSFQSSALTAVGRMDDAVSSARRASELDPLSPTATTEYILMLAQAGLVDQAKAELLKAEKSWAGTGALSEAQWGVHMRYGDPKIALTLPPAQRWEGQRRFLALRANPTPAGIQELVTETRKFMAANDSGLFGFAVQALAEFGQNEEVFRWFAQTPPQEIADQSYLLFRPALATARKDPRFMAVAAKVGLVKYWRSSGIWPDYCSDPNLPYDCKREAAKYAG